MRIQSLCCAIGVFSMMVATMGAEAEDWNQAKTLQSQGNFKEAYDKYQELILDPGTDSSTVARELGEAVGCLQRLNRRGEIDALLEGAVDAHGESWQVLRQVAEVYSYRIQHWGFVIGGTFERGPHRGGRGGRRVEVRERDRIRGLQLMRRALDAVARHRPQAATHDFYRSFADQILGGRGYSEAWRLQILTDLEDLPEIGAPAGGGRTQGAPVDADGNVVVYEIPDHFDAAENDGERWRWLLEQAANADPRRAHEVRLAFAEFLHQQFGVQTLAQYIGRSFAGTAEDERGGILAVHTLSDDETIARLATGIRRFTLPESYRFIHILREIAQGEEADSRRRAIQQLATVYENRRQYPRAVTWWEQFLPFDRRQAQQRIQQITGNWGEFEPVQTQPAGEQATVKFRFRNAVRAQVTAYRIDLERLVEDVRAYVNSKPERLEWQKINVGDIGRRLVWENETQYIDAQAASWGVRLEPRPDHFDKRMTMTTPLTEPGAYLVVCELENGNTSRIILALDDTVIVRKPLDKAHLVYVTDAVSGKPLAGIAVDFFGYSQQWIRKTNTHRIDTRQAAAVTDANGMIVLDHGDLPENYRWLITASDRGRFAYDGFTGIGFPEWYDREYRAVKIFTMTDRPVYRPGHTVNWKSWIRHAQYDLADESRFAGAAVSVTLFNPKNEAIAETTLTADEFGGVRGDFLLDEEATLGVYRIAVSSGGASAGQHFRVEEYKKPEFEVLIEAPSEPVMLGETAPAKILARYYFGAPVTEATVKVKVLRESHSGHWYPSMPWDWFYGPGYWWFAYDYDWYPGWSRWGCARPAPWWIDRGGPPPEVVVDAEMPIGPDGSVRVDISTLPAKELHGDSDHRYRITAEVRDASRRTIVGTGEILVAREPFKVYSWVDRGHYRVGDTIHASFQARRLDGKGVRGNGVLQLRAIRYDDERQPVETVVRDWPLATDDQGRARTTLTASEPGQYRLSYTLTDAQGHAIEGGYVFVVRGTGMDPREFRYSQIELIPDKSEYRPGDRMELAVNSDRRDATVLLFVRAANGVCKPPRVLSLDGRAAIVNIDVSRRDMPNFFVEAVTVFGGQVHSTVKELVVPPEKRVLGVEVLPSSARYQPGEEGRLRLKLTDAEGRPYAGSVVVSVYDKSVEYISGGSNVGDIRSFFWKWRRHHRESIWHTLNRWFRNLLKQGETGMGSIGVFGHVGIDADQAEPRAEGLGGGQLNGGRRFMRSKGAAAPAAAMAMDAVAAPVPLARTEAAAEAEAAPGDAGAQGEMAEPAVRTEFADTALWVAALRTGDDGIADIAMPLPDNLTTWKIRVWGMGHGTRVGEGSAEVITSKNLLLRLQAPRFFVQGDEVVLSANIHNYLDSGKDVQAVLELDGACLEVQGDGRRRIRIEAQGEQRVDWRVIVRREGEAVVRMKALTDEESDAVEMRFPVYVHGMDKLVPICGLIRPEDEIAEVSLEVPAARRVESTRLEVRYSPSLAMAMVDALPYLVDYPYGCTEQTLNRFLPTVITQNVLQRMGVSLRDIQEKRTHLNAQELGPDDERAVQWQRYDRNPVFDEALVADMVRDGVQTLAGMQLSDGGWGWFSGYGERSYPHTTAIVVHGLQVAIDNDVAVDQSVLQRGVHWLEGYQAQQIERLRNAQKDPRVHPWKTRADNLDALVFRVLADAGVMDVTMRDFLYRDRTSLSLQGMALFGLGLQRQDQQDQLAMILRNIGQYVVRDEENQTAYLNMPGGWNWWYWHGSEIEAHAAYLSLLSAAEPGNDLLPRLVKYLLNNRKHATYWRSTRDTALCVEAFADYITAVGEDQPDMTVAVALNGQTRKTVRIDAGNLFTFDHSLVLSGQAVSGGSHRLTIRKTGTGPLYWNAYLSYFTLEDPITGAGLEVKVSRTIYRLIRDDTMVDAAGARGQAVRQRAEHYRREEIAPDDILTSGQLIEVELVVESKNDYEYIVIEDMKAAGFEPVELRSGYTGNELGAYVEFRDERTTFFCRRLARGRHSVAYRLRAEIPGRFSALPARIWAMYAPELKGNSDEHKVRIRDE